MLDQRLCWCWFKPRAVQLCNDTMTLPANELDSYRPISNLSFVSKVLEKVVACHLNIHLNCNHLSNVFQSAEFHPTETALLKVHNDISLNMDTGKVTTLTLLDLSAAFDTIDYSVLLDLLSDWYGISDRAPLTWIRSFLTNRPQSIKIRKYFCFAVFLKALFLDHYSLLLYTTPLSSLIHGHKLDHHLYADDIQVYISLSTADTDLSLKQLGNRFI